MVQGLAVSCCVAKQDISATGTRREEEWGDLRRWKMILTTNHTRLSL
jgi:hypothetical protein